MTFLLKQFEEIDNSQLVIFRVFFGLLIFAESIGAILTGWVRKALIEPEFNFTLIGLEWMQPLDGNGMYFYFGLMGLCGIGVTLGLYYKWSMGLFSILWTTVYWMQKSFYNNHYYLLILLCLLMLLVPANQYFSLDAKRKPKIGSITCPKWCINVFILLLLIVYSYAAMHKFYPGWLTGDFIGLSFSAKENYPIIGQLLQNPLLQKIIVYGGIAFDGTLIPLLIYKRTRKFAFIVSLFFHLFNSAVFQIGIFPYLMICSSVFFFPPETIRRIFFKNKKAFEKEPLKVAQLNQQQIGLTIGLSVFFIIQLLLPLRHHRFEGNVFYTEEGHRLAWRMMLRSKSGSVSFRVNQTGQDSVWVINPRKYITSKQTRAMAGKPDMIWQMAQFLEIEYLKEGIDDVEVMADAFVRLNRGKKKRLIDPKTDLTGVPWDRFKHSNWILSSK